MDPWSPINGISLERYAELSAEFGDEKDPEKQAAIVANLGVQRPDWEAAKAGWTARMMDMSLMGQVATRYMPLYNAALAKKPGNAPPDTSFEDYVGMSGCVPVMGQAGMLAHYKLTQTQWTQIAMKWNQAIQTNPQYVQYGLLVEAEANRIRTGGPPRPLTGNAGGPAAFAATSPAPQPYQQQQPQPYAQPQPAGQYAPQAYQQQQQAYYGNQAQQFGNQVGNAFSSFGSALGSFVDGAIGFQPGSRVMVQWSDGNRYPGTVTQVRPPQIEVAFPDGRRVWVPQNVVTSASY